MGSCKSGAAGDTEVLSTCRVGRGDRVGCWSPRGPRERHLQEPEKDSRAQTAGGGAGRGDGRLDIGRLVLKFLCQG